MSWNLWFLVGYSSEKNDYSDYVDLDGDGVKEIMLFVIGDLIPIRCYKEVGISQIGVLGVFV